MKFVCLFALVFVVGFTEIGAVPAEPSLKLFEWKDELLNAVSSSDLNWLEFLIQNYVEYSEYLPDVELLHFAADKNSGNIDIAEYLLLVGYELDEKDRHLGFTPLARAVKSGNFELAKFFIENGADVNTQTQAKVTPLHLSINWGNSKFVQFLIAKGANVNAQDRDGNSALHRTTFKSNIKLAKILIENGANVNIMNMKFFKHTPLHSIAIFAIFGQHDGVEYTKLLIENGADLKAKDSLNRTPYDLAVKYGHSEIAAVLKATENEEQ